MNIEAYEEELEMEQEHSKIIIEPVPEPVPIIHGKILDDNGNVIEIF